MPQNNTPPSSPPSSPRSDSSNNTFDLSCNVVTYSSNVDLCDVSTNVLPPIVHHTLDETINGIGYTIRNQQGVSADGTEITHSIFFTTDLSNSDVQINQDLAELVETQYDDLSGSENGLIVNQIKEYAQKIQCTDFHGKGTIEDYEQLFIAASKIANESKQMDLNIEIEGFNEFAQAAEEMSDLFNSFIMKLQNVNIINDTSFLRAILSALQKIFNLSEVFGKFKQTILATSTIQIPKSAHDTSMVLRGLMDEIHCAMDYVNYFVNPTTNIPINAELSPEEKNIIDKAVTTIESWNVLCEQGVSIAISNNSDISFINNASRELKSVTQNLKNSTQSLKSKLASYNITKFGC
jgi:hypothetical protein